jgi:hypothetical protein
LGSLLCLGRHCITGLIGAGGRAMADWSADYRLLERGRIDMERLFGTIRRGVLGQLGPADAPVVVALDDTLIRKSGRKVHGAAWRRDPLGPKFQTNLAWGQRFLQFSMMLPETDAPAGRARAIPIRFDHCPTLKKLKPTASPQAKAAWKAQAAPTRLPAVAAQSLARLRRQMDQDGQAGRGLIVSGDGGYTNKTVLAGLPERATFVGRLRKDAKLCAPPPPQAPGARGRRRQYGEVLPTPEQTRQDEARPWRQVTAWAAGKLHAFDVKVVGPVRWRAGGPRDLQLMIVRPLAYRLHAGSSLLYREAAYLICTDPQMDAQQMLQAYLWRWEIEVNHREEKTLLGVGQPQARAEQAAALAPAFQVAAYAGLLLAMHAAYGQAGAGPLPQPKWQRPDPAGRLSTAKAIGILRAEAWGAGIRHFSGFAPGIPLRPEPQKNDSSLAQALCLASP